MMVSRGTYADGGIVEIVKGNDGADIDECSAIEQQIDDVREHGVFGILVKETVPCECRTTCESRQEIVTS
jgi:hypothetical protein